MPTQIVGTTGVSQVQAGSIYPDDLALVQTLQDFTSSGSRAPATLYTNSTPQTIWVMVSISSTAVCTSYYSLNGVNYYGNLMPSPGNISDLTFPVPSGYTYKVDGNAGVISKVTWTELR